jgi:hypothetical protein
MRRYVTRLCLTLCMLLALCAPGFAAENPALREGQLALNAVQALIEQQISSIQGSLTVLATASEVQSLDWDTMQPLLSSLEQHCPPCAIWFAKPDGTYYTVQNGLMDQTLSDRSYFAPLIGGEEVLGDIVISKSTGQLSAIVAVPVFQNNQIVGALGASVFTENAAGSLAASLELPADMSLLVLDAEGQTVCAIPAEGPQWAEDIQKIPFAESAGATDLEIGGEPVTVIAKVSAFNGWRYLIGIPRK